MTSPVADHEGTDVEGRAGAEGRNPGGVGRNDLLDGLDELVLGERGHHRGAAAESYMRSALRSGRKQTMLPVFGGVCLEALEDLLAVMEDAARTRRACRVWSVVRPPSSHSPSVTVVADVAVVSRHGRRTRGCPNRCLSFPRTIISSALMSKRTARNSTTAVEYSVVNSLQFICRSVVLRRRLRGNSGSATHPTHLMRAGKRPSRP